MSDDKLQRNYQEAVLCNSDESIPDVFYIFTNTSNLITKHNLQATKGFTSGSIGEILAREELQKKYFDGTLDYYQYIPNPQPDIGGMSMYALNATTEYRIEYNCEGHRKTCEDAKFFPSRLSALYAFGDYESCEGVSQKYNWSLDSVKKYRLLNLPFTRVAKVNMEIISLMRTVERQASWGHEEQVKIWHHYWMGGANIDLELPTDGGDFERISSGVIWEYLIEGRVELIEV